MIRKSTLFTCGVFLLLPAVTFAQATFNGGGDGTTWNDAANWDTGMLPAANVNIPDAFTVSLSTDQTVNEIDLVGDQSAGTAVLNHTAGTLSGGGWMKVGVDLGNDGTFTMSGTAAMSGFSDLHGGTRGGTGTINLTDSASFSHVGSLNPVSYTHLTLPTICSV